MQQKIDINEGYSLNYLVHAFFIIVAGIILFTVHFVLAIIVIVIGTLLLFAQTGVAIDLGKKQAIAFRSIFNFRIGTTIDLTKFNHVRLKYTNESSLMESRGTTTQITTKSYTLFLSLDKEQKTLLHEFTKYNLARKAFKAITDDLGYEGYDEVAALKKR